MVSDPSLIANEPNVIVEKKPDDGLHPDKKGQVKVPKRIHKAEREKLKRDQLNELFVDLGNVLGLNIQSVTDLDGQNNCKASILGDTTRTIRDLFAQVESLKKENADLLSESSYITLERDEMKDENSKLKAEVSELQIKLQGSMNTDPAWTNNIGADSQIVPHPSSMLLQAQHQPLVTEPVHVAPIRELQLFPESRTSTPPTSPRTF